MEYYRYNPPHQHASGLFPDVEIYQGAGFNFNLKNEAYQDVEWVKQILKPLKGLHIEIFDLKDPVNKNVLTF